MKYLLDTNICVYWLNGDKAIEKKAIQVGLKHIAVSFVSLSELYYGAYKSQKVKQNLSAIKSLESLPLQVTVKIFLAAACRAG